MKEGSTGNKSVRYIHLVQGTEYAEECVCAKVRTKDKAIETGMGESDES